MVRDLGPGAFPQKGHLLRYGQHGFFHLQSIRAEGGTGGERSEAMGE